LYSSAEANDITLEGVPNREKAGNTGSIPGRRKDSLLRNVHAVMLWVSELKWPKLQTDHLPASHVTVWNALSFTFQSPLLLYIEGFIALY
jgi:hypothetical protein